MTVETPVSERLLALFCHDRVGGEVYIVSSGEYENNHIEAVFSSKENADEYIRLTKQYGTPERWGAEPSVEKWSVDTVQMIAPVSLGVSE